MIKETGFLLSYIKYGDHDAVLHCFTKETGFSSFFVKGIYAPKNKKKAYLLALNELEISLNTAHTSIKQVSRIEQVRNVDLYSEIKMSSVVFFVAEFLHQILKNETAQEVLYHEIRDFAVQVEQKNYQAHLVFLLRMLSYQGIAPSHAAAAYLDPTSGTFEATQSHHLFDENLSHIWKIMIVSEFSYAQNIAKEDRRTFLESILLYYHYHFADFKTPKSLEILTQIFEPH